MGLLSRKTKRDCLSGTGVELRGRHYWQQWLAFILSSLVYIPSRLVYVRRLICAEYVVDYSSCCFRGTCCCESNGRRSV